SKAWPPIVPTPKHSPPRARSKAPIAFSPRRPPPPYASPTANRKCWMVRLPTRKNSSPATISSRRRTLTPHSPGPRVAPPRATVSSKFVRSGRCNRPQRQAELDYRSTIEAPIVPNEHITPTEGDAQARITADAVARRSYGKLVAFLAARSGDVASAEDALS